MSELNKPTPDGCPQCCGYIWLDFWEFWKHLRDAHQQEMKVQAR